MCFQRKKLITLKISHILFVLFFVFITIDIYARSTQYDKQPIKSQKSTKKDNYDRHQYNKNPKKIDAYTKQYIGEVVPIVVETMSSGANGYFYGSVEIVARLGSIIRPEITDMDGNIVEKGTVVMQQGTRYWKAIVEGNKASLIASKENLKTATLNFERYKELSVDGAESVQLYQAYQKKYFDAIGQVKMDEGALAFNQRMLDTRTQIAPFEGIVTKVLYIMGRASGNPQTVELTQLNPIGIKVQMTREEANKINSNTPVTV